MTMPLSALTASSTALGVLPLTALRGMSLQPFQFAALTDGLSAIPGIRPPLQVLTRGRLTGMAEVLVLDGNTMREGQIENEFTYPLLEILQKFPEARSGSRTYRRPLLYASFGEADRDSLFIGLIETHAAFHGRGIGSASYRELQSLGRGAGYRFLGHYHNDLETAGFFLRRGGYFLEEIRPERQAEFRELRAQETDPKVFHTVSFLEPDALRKYLPESILRASVGRRVDARRLGVSLDVVPRKVQSLHFLIHPLFVGDPWETTGEDARQGYADSRALSELYLEKARSLPEDGVLFMFSHLRLGEWRKDHPYHRLYAQLVRGLTEALGNRFFLRDDSGLFDDLKVAGSLHAEMRARGHTLGADLESFAYGEVPELCVADGSENLREGFDLERPTVIETRYSNWMEPYPGGSPGMEAEFRGRGLVLK